MAIFRSKASQLAGYRADIDGLRAIAVLAVVAFHAKVPLFPGGYVGVDVFFVISGYLITGILSRKDSSFLEFYDRRVRRIFPALFATCLLTTLWAICVFAPQQLQSYGSSLLAVAGFVSNLYFRAATHVAGYFGDGVGEQYLLHTWSLAVEEQFYLLFPVVLLCLRRLRKPGLLLLAVVSFGLSVHGLKTDPIGTFYLLPGRAWELLLGALLALKPLPVLRSTWIRSLLGLTGLAAILFAVFSFTAVTPFPGAAALIPCLGAALVIYSGENGPSLVAAGLATPPLVFVGVISYSLYLWHWPVIAAMSFYEPSYGVSPGLQVREIVISLALAVLSYWLIEAPFRKSDRTERTKKLVVTIGVAGSLSLALCGLALILSHGFPRRFNALKAETMAVNFARKDELPGARNCGIFMVDVKRAEDIPFCKTGNANRNILFWGDSHTWQLYPLLQSMQQAGDFHGRGFVTAMAGGCPVGETINRSEPGFHCDMFTHFTMERAEKGDIDTVFFSYSPFWATVNGMVCASDGHHCQRILTGEEAWSLFLKDFEARILKLQADGKHVIITVPFPIYDTSIPILLNRNLALAKFGVAPIYPTQLIPASEVTDIRELAARTGATLYDPRTVLCPKDGVCRYVEDGKSLYSDQSHLATSQLDRLRTGILAAANTSSRTP